MKQSMDITELSQHVVDRYRHYLQTMFSFSDPELSASFEKALKAGNLSKGPWIGATPPFQRGRTPRELFTKILPEPPHEVFLQALVGNRALYRHQDEAISQIVQEQNVIVATGTGSGKTEAFLYPILLHLYQEHLKGELGSGVRALILYPMNALAYDQRERLGEICRKLEALQSPFRFTFGQYIGATPEDEKDTWRQARDHLDRRLPGELVLRSEMRETPPHILLSNYSMLEYLLLRPQDSLLFDRGRARRWTFLVLDEAHQYRGTKGTEMAMLLRRLKQRLREGGRSGSFRCIATSASLVSKEEDRAGVAHFATDLFGEPFLRQNVILSELEPIEEPESPIALNAQNYQTLLEILDKDFSEVQARAQVEALTHQLGIAVSTEEEDLATWVGALLERDQRTTTLRRKLTDHILDVKEAAETIFANEPQDHRLTVLTQLLSLLSKAKGPDTDSPLFIVRYHLFVRSLEGAFITFRPQKRVLLSRGGAKVGVNSEELSAVFELALCRECGQHYLVGRIDGHKFKEAVRDPSREAFGVCYLRPLDKSYEPHDEDKKKLKIRHLCVQCGTIGQPGLKRPTCNHSNSDWIQVLEEPRHTDKERTDQLKTCSVCGYNASGHDPVREIIYGNSGPQAVIATTLYQRLPQGRKRILAFADGRQDAASFAWYLEDSYRDVQNRSLILRAARQLAVAAGTEGLSLQDLVDEMLPQLRKLRPASETNLKLSRKAWHMLYREFLTDEVRISLEGTGLIRWRVQLPEWFELPPQLTQNPWNLSEEEARDLISFLLDTMRKSKAVELRAGDKVTIGRHDLGPTFSQMRLRIGKPRGTKGIQSWDGERTRRAKFLTRLLEGQGLPPSEAQDHAIEALRLIWEALTDGDHAPSPEERLLLRFKDGKVLNPDWWRLFVLLPEDTLYRCDTCGSLQTLSIKGLCPRYRCTGYLQPVVLSELSLNHYRLLYQAELPGNFRVEEHTAQLSPDQAQEYQKDFKGNRINVLSCSTTFELGVDLGELDVTFLRNVPPEPFNYAQRVGRAGRRSEPGFAITYCRRSPHDLYHFEKPNRMLGGKTRPPTLSLRNKKILVRHLVTWALSTFFREYPERFESVENFVGNWEHATLLADLEAFLHKHQEKIEVVFREIMPTDPTVTTELGLNEGRWIDKILNREGRLSLAVEEVLSDYQIAIELKKISSDNDDFTTAKWAKNRAKTIAGEDVLSFISRKAIIPKYGFPVDVVALDTQGTTPADRISLQRDLRIAIAEYAPTAEVMANKRIWTSSGLKRVKGRDEKTWAIHRYKKCHRHDVFCQWQKGEQEPELPCDCSATVFSYLVPRFGFIADRKSKEPTSGPQRLFSTRPFFVGLVDSVANCVQLPGKSPKPVMSLTKASQGSLVVLCEGRRGTGFYVCLSCGAGFRGRKKSPHTTPYGQSCDGELENFSLGHEFTTDVIRLEFHTSPPDVNDPIGFAYSLAYALSRAAAEILDVPLNDLNTTVSYREGTRVPPIVLYDDVPGGAGLVTRLEDGDLMKQCLELAQKRVNGDCGCGEHDSCYICLRSYRNQFMHDRLQRGSVYAYLQQILNNWV